MIIDLKLKDFTLENGNHFIAMEYYRLILNRTFLVLITDENLVGLKVNGMVSIESQGNSYINQMAIKDDLENPYSYMKSDYVTMMENLSIYGEEILSLDKANYIINYQEIEKVTYNSKKKWGMGYYPHDGKVYLITKNNLKKEFIILGKQSGEEIRDLIVEKMENTLQL